MIGVSARVSVSAVCPSWSRVFVSTKIARSTFAGSLPSGTVIPRFSRSCLVEALTPSGQTIFVEVAGASFRKRLWSAKAEQVASGSAF